MKRKTEIWMVVFMAVLLVTGLTACGGYQIETGSVSGGAVSGQAVSGSAVSDSTVLNVHVMTEGKVTIPNPAVVEGSADVYLRKSPDDDIYVEDHYEDEIVPSVYEDFVADLSFLGFDEPVFVSSYAIGNLTKATDSIAHVMTQTKKGIKEKEIKGDCLALFVTAGIPTAEDYRKDVVNGIDSRSYIVVLDYGAGKTYKAKTYFWLHNIQNWNDLEAVDLTGDGVQELAVQHCYNKTIQYGAYRVNRETEEFREIYSTLLSEEAGRYREEDGFKGTLLDEYKVKLEFPDIGYSETISMIKDAGYKEEELQTEKRMYEDGSYNFVALWKDGTLKGHGTVFLYTMDSVDYIKNKDGSVWVDFAWMLAVEHRSCGIGTMHVYYEYDKAKDTLVLAGAKYVDLKQALKEWEEWTEERTKE
ncbi:MAG: hypothetical protein PUG66_00850 [Clostridiales bacterium]|nr:hypothetical protein [Clostridiales bacterium]